jgi:adenylate cyclase
MTDIFISYARPTEAKAQRVEEALRGMGHDVWRDDQLAAHQAFGQALEERLAAAKVVLVLWSADAARSEWVRSEASRARAMGKLVQLTLDKSPLPMPFDQIQCANLVGWNGEADAPGWRRVVASIADLMGGPALAPETPLAEDAPLTLPGKPSIAVMPFANLSGDREQDYFADGMVEEIAAAMARFRSLFVIASGSTLAFKGSTTAPSEIGRRLGVRYLLDGSVRRSGDRVRITVKLIDATDGAQMWSERFEDTLQDVFALQDRVALSVAGVIEPTVREAEIKRAAQRPTSSLTSYDLFLRAQAILRTYHWSELFEAIALAEQAVVLDPGFGQALSLASRCHYLAMLYGLSADPEAHRTAALELSLRATRAASDDAYVLGNTAMLTAYLQHDVASAITMVERACALNPGAASAWFSSGAIRILADQLDLAVEHLRTAMRLNPVGPEHYGAVLFLAMARFQQRRYEEAVALANELYQHAENPTGFAILAASLGHLGQAPEAREALANYVRLSGRSIEDYAVAVWPRDDHRSLFLDGIAAAGT